MLVPMVMDATRTVFDFFPVKGEIPMSLLISIVSFLHSSTDEALYSSKQIRESLFSHYHHFYHEVVRLRVFYFAMAILKPSFTVALVLSLIAFSLTNPNPNSTKNIIYLSVPFTGTHW